jgi:hypothetical protein
MTELMQTELQENRIKMGRTTGGQNKYEQNEKT